MQVERLLRQASEFASEHEAWKLNLAHVHYMQASRAPAANAGPYSAEAYLQLLQSAGYGTM